jgi:hypothetical protein
LPQQRHAGFPSLLHTAEYIISHSNKEVKKTENQRKSKKKKKPEDRTLGLFLVSRACAPF